jgi:hypothetical protein
MHKKLALSTRYPQAAAADGGERRARVEES